MHSKLGTKLNRLTVWSRSLAPVRIRNDKFGDLDEYCASYARLAARPLPTRTLDIGCGKTPRNPFGAQELFGIDIREDKALNVNYADLIVEPIPYPDAYFDFVTAYDFIEHVPRILYAPGR